MLKLHDVSYVPYKGTEPILEQINFSIPHGQWVSIVGRNGSGKSTLIRLLNGLLPHTSGTITVDGLILNEQTIWDIRTRVGMVFANPDNQFVGTTVAEDIVFGLENLCLSRDEMKERLHHYATMLKVDALLDRHPSTLSGGQKQRVAIAAILACEPKLIVFDEPTSMLDEASRSEVLEMMHMLKASGRYTIITVTHEHAELFASDRAIAIADGTIIADDKPARVLAQEHVLNACRLNMPYTLKLCNQLREKGIDIGTHIDADEVVKALWAYTLRA